MSMAVGETRRLVKTGKLYPGFVPLDSGEWLSNAHVVVPKNCYLKVMLVVDLPNEPQIGLVEVMSGPSEGCRVWVTEKPVKAPSTDYIIEPLAGPPLENWC